MSNAIAAGHGLKNKEVKIANALTMAAQSLSLAEKRILFSAIAKASGKTATVNLTAQEYSATYEMPLNQAYEQMKNAAKNIFNCYITLIGLDKEGETRHFRWIQEYAYKDRSGSVDLVFSNRVVPHLLGLEVKFTKYKLRQTCAIRSVYSWRLLELFEQQSRGWLVISLADFHHAMDATETHRKNFKDTRVHIIESAIKELQETGDWIISWETKKYGRKVISLRFDFSRKSPEEKTLALPNPEK